MCFYYSVCIIFSCKNNSKRGSYVKCENNTPVHLSCRPDFPIELARFPSVGRHAYARTRIISITNNTNIAAVVVVVRRVAHLQRVVGNARASGGAAARRRPPPPPPRSTLSFAPPGRHRSPWTSSGARPARKNCWSSIRLDVSTPAFCVVLAPR